MIIGRDWRRAATAIGIALVVGLGFGLRSAVPALADPPLVAARGRALMTAAAAADAGLASLAAVLSDAIDHARSGSAETVAGDRPPAPELQAAADALGKGSETADAAHRAVAALAGMASAIAPDRPVPALPYGSPDLLAMAAGLRTSADAAALFVERRHATETIVGALADAVSALDRDLPAAAVVSLDGATAPLALLDDWVERPPLLGYWMKVIHQLVDAARGIATATLQGDPVAQKAAAERYGKAAEAARGADNALAVSLAEEGGAVSVVQLQRLAAAASAVSDARVTAQLLAASAS
jgi:hypothetical protein